MKWHLVLAGLLLGAGPSLLVNMPAAWLARAVNSASEGRVLLADATGTMWSGSAVLAVAAGPSPASALRLPGRTSWRLGLHSGQAAAWLQQSCCTETPLLVLWQPGWQHQKFSVAPAASPGSTAPWGRWPLELLSGLGAPWNTMRLSGTLQLTSQQPLRLTQAPGRWHTEAQLDVELLHVASRLSPLPALGDYRVQVRAEAGAATTQLVLQTLKGPLQLQGTGHWDLQGLHLRAQASAAPGAEAGLNNLLNIIGVRDGAVSNLSIQ